LHAASTDVTLVGLNPPQREAVHHTDGPLLVLAGAGSGKTAVITQKISWLIRAGHCTPSEIAAVTFTNKAAREMKARVATLLHGEDTRGLSISTFHTLGLNILRHELALSGFKAGFSIHDSEDGLNLVRELARGVRGAAPEAMHWQISQWKSALISPEHAAAQVAEDTLRLAAAGVYPQYQRALRACNALDFDDLINEPIRLLREHADVRSRWQRRIRYLLVDEYQDTNLAQYELVRLLAGERAAFTVVGDDDQSVYAWRGARPENLRSLASDYPNLKVIKLEQNYRCSARILRLANQLIAANPHVFEKRLWSDLETGEPARVLSCRDDEHEAERVVSALMQHRFQHRGAYRDYAILYRGNHQARVFERVLREQRIPYYLSGGLSFFERTEVRDVMAYLRLIANPDDDSAFLRVVNTPRREIGSATLEKLASYAQTRDQSLYAACFELGLAQHLGDRSIAALRRFAVWLGDLHERAQQDEVSAVLTSLLTDTAYDAWLKETCDSVQVAERRMQNVLELTGWMTRLARQEQEPPAFAELVAKLSLIGMLDDEEEDRSDQVSLMTLHAAKGLEFPYVFIVGMEEGLLPHRSSLSENVADVAGLEEERRLTYVGITRAKCALTFSYALQRKRYGEVVECAPSRFLSELPEADLVWDGQQSAATPGAGPVCADDHLRHLRHLLGNS